MEAGVERNNIQVLPIDFMGQGALIEPVDRKLHDIAVDYCRRELQDGDKINLVQFAKCWVVLRGEEAIGFAGYVLRPDVPVFRVSGDAAVRATAMLADRMRSFFQDNGCRGQEVFLHISSKEKPEQRCEKWESSLEAVGAIPADRFSVRV